MDGEICFELTDAKYVSVSGTCKAACSLFHQTC